MGYFIKSYASCLLGSLTQRIEPPFLSFDNAKVQCNIQIARNTCCMELKKSFMATNVQVFATFLQVNNCFLDLNGLIISR